MKTIFKTVVCFSRDRRLRFMVYSLEEMGQRTHYIYKYCSNYITALFTDLVSSVVVKMNKQTVVCMIHFAT